MVRGAAAVEEARQSERTLLMNEDVLSLILLRPVCQWSACGVGDGRLVRWLFHRFGVFAAGQPCCDHSHNISV